jgi:hypothetical protein
MAKYLATYSDTINEVEVTGFNLMTDKEMERFEELASSITWDFVYLVGEEEIEYSSGDDLLSRIDFREISNEEYKILNKVFDEGFGVFVNEYFLLDIIDEESDEEEEEEDDDFDRQKDDDDEY